MSATYHARRQRELEEVELPPDGSVDAGLILLMSVGPPGRCWSQEEIAQVCGCSRTMIWQLENRALQKLRRPYVVKKLKEAMQPQ